jgi:hypothetical protein
MGDAVNAERALRRQGSPRTGDVRQGQHSTLCTRSMIVGQSDQFGGYRRGRHHFNRARPEPGALRRRLQWGLGRIV